jgi:ubiquinol-cytochrome c reductase cytochrome c1 subunit
MLARSSLRSTRTLNGLRNGASAVTKRAVSSSSNAANEAIPTRLNVAAVASTSLAVGSIAWYYHMYGPVAHASAPAEEGLHPASYPWVHEKWFKTFDHQA